MAARLAAYWTPPPDHPLWRAGCAWLGRDPSADADADGTPPPGRCEPWRYGFHATLKRPIALRNGLAEASFFDAVRALARACRPFQLPPLDIVPFGGFLALRPRGGDEGAAVRALMSRCVRSLDPLAAAPADRAGLAGELGRAFHLTLTDPLHGLDPVARRTLVSQAREQLAAALALPCEVASISVFVEPHAGAPLRLVERLPLAGVCSVNRP